MSDYVTSLVRFTRVDNDYFRSNAIRFHFNAKYQKIFRKTGSYFDGSIKIAVARDFAFTVVINCIIVVKVTTMIILRSIVEDVQGFRYDPLDGTLN